jgi:2-oxo-3-hexenedioate decarboxylase
MTPQQLLRHSDTGTLWSDGEDASFTELPVAYETALAVRALRVARGERPCGYKVGFTNRTLWSRYGVYAPIWGTVWDTTVSHCEDAGRVSLASLCQPRIEPEAVFGFQSTPPADASLDDLVASLDWVAAGFETVQSHRPDWKFVAGQAVADAGLHAKLLIGRKLPVGELALSVIELDRSLAAARVSLSRDGNRVEEGTGANVLDGPVRALLYFLAELRACPGAPDVVAGDVVTTGTRTEAWPGKAGQTGSSRFDSVLPDLNVAFD